MTRRPRHRLDLPEVHATPFFSSQPMEVHMSRYVDGFVVPVPKRKLAAYRRMAQNAGKVWRDHGAVEFRECVADDVKVGKWTSFPRSVKLKKGEAVFFSYIVFKSRAHR